MIRQNGATSPPACGRSNDAKRESGLDRNLHDLRGTFDDEIVRIVGWNTACIPAIREKYCNNARVVIAIGERIAAAKSE